MRSSLVVSKLLLIWSVCLLVDGDPRQGPTSRNNFQNPLTEPNNGNRPQQSSMLSPDNLLLLTKLAVQLGLETGQIDQIISLVKVGFGLIELIDQIFDKFSNGTNIEINLGGNGQLLDVFQGLSVRLDQINTGVHGIEASIRRISNALPQMIKWENMVNALEQETRPVDVLYERFRYYQKHRQMVETYTLLNFADSVVSHESTSIMNRLAHIHNMVAPDSHSQANRIGGYRPEEFSDNAQFFGSTSDQPRNSTKDSDRLSLRASVFDVLEKTLQAYDQCDMQQSHQQMAMGLYSLITLTQARGFAMVNFAYMLLRLNNRGNFTEERLYSRQLYEKYTKDIRDRALAVINKADNTYRNCDPASYIQGENFVMFTQLLQGHLENEADINKQRTCTRACYSYEHTPVEGCSAGERRACSHPLHQSCRGGRLHDCRQYDSDGTVCYSRSPYKRYDYVRYENGRRLGPDVACSGTTQKVDSWWRFFVHCTSCICLCDDQTSPTSDRYISLLPALSDYSNNMVVTGIKFAKQNRVVMLQIQQGRTMPQGQVDPASLQWVTPQHVNTTKSQAVTASVEGRDYHTLSYPERSMDLDALAAPTSHVVTGVRFRKLGSHVNLEIHVTPVNFTSGQLNGNLSFWSSIDQTPHSAVNPRTPIVLHKPDDPVRQTGSSIYSDSRNKFIEFQPTDMDKDASQMTVPYLDSQVVQPYPATWLNGVALQHKAARGSGGFITLQLTLYNTTRHFEHL